MFFLKFQVNCFINDFFSADVNDEMRFQFITEGCGDENELDAESLVIYSTGESTHSAFSIQAFQFHDSDTAVYFHCQVSAAHFCSAPYVTHSR